MKTELRLIKSPAARPASQGPVSEVVTVRGHSEIFSLVYRQMRALAGRSRDLDDLVQMAAEQVFRSVPSFEDRSALATWTYRVCYHTLLKQRRWYRRWRQRFAYASDGVLADEIDGNQSHSARLLEQHERACRLRQALEKLSPKLRVVVVMHDLDEFEVEEVAAIIEANVLTVRSRLRDGRRRLAQALEKDVYFGDEACGQEAT